MDRWAINMVSTLDKLVVLFVLKYIHLLYCLRIHQYTLRKTLHKNII